jgi:hypothetical protein
LRFQLGCPHLSVAARSSSQAAGDSNVGAALGTGAKHLRESEKQMKETIKLPFKDPTIRQMVLAAFPEAKTRRPVSITSKASYHVSDFWDGGSRTYCAFLRLSDMTAVSSEMLPQRARQEVGNPYNLPIGHLPLSPGYAIVEHIIFCGKDLGYRIILHPANSLPSAEETRQMGPNAIRHAILG